MAKQGGRQRNAVLRCDVLLVAAVVFVLLTSIAIAVYPGSSHLNHSTTGYSFTVNFFSDLGATRVYSEHLNIASAVLFMIALAGVGAAIVLFSFNTSVIALKNGRRLAASKAATVCGVISGIAFIGIASAPENVSDTTHVLFVQIAFGFLLLFVVWLAWVQLANGWPVAYMVPNFVYLAILAAYVVLLFFGPGIDNLRGLEIQAIGQKIVVYSSIINVTLQAYGVRRYLLKSAGESTDAVGT